MASRMTVQHLQRLKEELTDVQAEIRTLLGREAGLKRAIAIVSDDPTLPDDVVATSDATRKRRSPIKDIVLRLLQENAERGLVAIDLVELAKAQGITLDRNSVSSILSRFKRDGVLDYDGKVYRPKRPFHSELRVVA